MDAIYLAPDPDREGEAIAAHLAFELGGNGHGKKAKKKKKEDADAPPRIQRVTFNEITKRAVQAAFEHPRAIDQNLVDAQQARRVLDRLVGYQVSPLLWDKVRRGLSAGRVQTVALRLIVEREREIKAFEKKEYWTIDAHLAASKPPAFDARFVGKGEEKIEVTNGEDAEKIRAALEQADWLVRSVDKKERRRNAAPPFTTSKLQQDSSRKLRFSVKRTMMIAQRLYEGVELGEEGLVGLITYMRTDSTRVAPEAIQEVREYVGKEYGPAYLPETPNTYKEKKEAQAAHEAIRPTSAMRHPDQVKQYLKEDEFKVYKLIWQRFVASQIMPAVFDQTTVDIDAKSKTETFWFRVTGSVLKFDGFLRVYEESKEGKDEEDEELKHKLPAAGSWTEAHAERIEAGAALHRAAAALQRSFAGEGTGRAGDRASVNLFGDSVDHSGAAVRAEARRKIYADRDRVGGHRSTGRKLPRHFRHCLYRRAWKKELDEIEEGKEKWTDTLAEFYKKFTKDLKYAEKHMENIKRMEKPTDEKCENCGAPLVIKWGRHGSFYACSTYDKEDPNTCTFTKENPINLPDLDSADVQETGAGRILRELRPGDGAEARSLRAVHGLHGLSRLQDDHGGWIRARRFPDIPLDESCPKCGRNMMIRHGRFGEFTACSGYPECKYVKQNFIGVKCPECKEGELVEKRARKGNTFYGCGNYPKCKFTSAHKPIAEKCTSCGSEYLVEKESEVRTGDRVPEQRVRLREGGASRSGSNDQRVSPTTALNI